MICVLLPVGQEEASGLPLLKLLGSVLPSVGAMILIQVP